MTALARQSFGVQCDFGIAHEFQDLVHGGGQGLQRSNQLRHYDPFRRTSPGRGVIDVKYEPRIVRPQPFDGRQARNINVLNGNRLDKRRISVPHHGLPNKHCVEQQHYRTWGEPDIGVISHGVNDMGENLQDFSLIGVDSGLFGNSNARHSSTAASANSARASVTAPIFSRRFISVPA